MRVIVVGAGQTGREIAEMLVREQHEVVVIERDASRLAPLRERLDARLVHGNGASPRLLREAGAAEADLLIAVTASDETNIVAAIIARERGTRQTVVRVHGEDYLEAGESYREGVLGIDVAINPERVAAEDVARAAQLPGALAARLFCDARVTVAQIVLHDSAPAIGTRMSAYAARGYALLGGARGERALLAGAEEPLQAQDRLLLAAPRGRMAEAMASLVGPQPTVDRAVVVGAGQIGLETAGRLLDVGVHVTVLDGDEERAREAAERLPNAVVRHQHALGGDDLAAAGAAGADALIACTQDDQTNLIVALAGHDLGCRIAIPVIHNRELEPLVTELGLDAAIAPRRVTTSRILGLASGTRVVRVETVQEGLSLAELRVSDDMALCGRRPSETTLPDGVAVAAIVRGEEVIAARADAQLRHGDRILIMLSEVDVAAALAALAG